jgi:hypothetical protein
MDLAFWEATSIALPFFEPYFYTWEGKFFHCSWSFEISFKIIIHFEKLDYAITFIFTIRIFVLYRSKFTKKSSRIAYVMEIFYTLLQCKGHLIMFHPTSI